MLDRAPTGDATTGGHVECVAAGTSAVGAFHCSECGYGVTVHAALPSCPMCSGTTWELHDWKPFTKPSRLL